MITPFRLESAAKNTGLCFRNRILIPANSNHKHDMAAEHPAQAAQHSVQNCQQPLNHEQIPARPDWERV